MSAATVCQTQGRGILTPGECKTQSPDTGPIQSAAICEDIVSAINPSSLGVGNAAGGKGMCDPSGVYL